MNIHIYIYWNTYTVIYRIYVYVYIYTLEVQPPFFICWFINHLFFNIGHHPPMVATTSICTTQTTKGPESWTLWDSKPRILTTETKSPAFDFFITFGEKAKHFFKHDLPLLDAIRLGVSKNRGTPKWIKMDGLQWKTLLKWMIWGYHYFWKHPFGLEDGIAKWRISMLQLHGPCP